MSKARREPYYTDEMRRWLGGYDPVLAAEMCLPRAGKVSDPVRLAQLKREAGARKNIQLKGEKA